MADAGEVEVVRGWISTGFLGAILLVIVRLGKPVTDYLIESHRNRIEEKRIREQARKDDRQGYGELIEALTAEVHELREETRRQRAEIRSLHDMIDGLTRGELQARRSAQVVDIHTLPPSAVPPATAAALERMKGIGE